MTEEIIEHDDGDSVDDKEVYILFLPFPQNFIPYKRLYQDTCIVKDCKQFFASFKNFSTISDISDGKYRPSWKNRKQNILP